MKRIAVLMTCHNRCAGTIACLEALFRNQLPEGVSLEVFLVDDGSSDGTGGGVRCMFPDVHVIDGDGSLYWNGGMRMAFDAAMEQDFDYYLWLNDDTLLYPHALSILLQTAETTEREQGHSAVVVGTTQAAPGGPPTYGGVVRVSLWRPLKFRLVTPSDEPVQCETMNGNCVLIPRAITKAVGNLDEAFIHTMGDMDYGLRARDAGFPVVVMPGFAGTCSNNPVERSHADTNLSIRERLGKVSSPKRLPLRPWFVFVKRHSGLYWLAYWLWPYVKIVASSWGFRRP